MTAAEPKFIYKIVEAAHWHNAQGQEFLPPMAIDVADGYMHFSTVTQLKKTLELYFAGQTDVAILAIEVSLLPVPLKWEPSRGGDLFPHFYGQLPMSCIVLQEFVDIAADGQCILPGTIV